MILILLHFSLFFVKFLELKNILKLININIIKNCFKFFKTDLNRLRTPKNTLKFHLTVAKVFVLNKIYDEFIRFENYGKKSLINLFSLI